MKLAKLSTCTRHRTSINSQKHGVSILRLPPYNCELNPIDLVMSQVKRHVAMNNTIKKKLMIQLIGTAFDTVTNGQCIHYCNHVGHIANNLWKVR